MSEDSATILAEFVTSLDNLPSELEHIMAEIKGKEQTIHELRNKCEGREIAIAKFHKAHGLLANNPKEVPTMQKLRTDYQRMQQLSDDKVRLAERALAIVTRHCGRFERELAKLQGGSMPALMPIAPTPISPSAPASPYTSMHSPSLMASTSSTPPLHMPSAAASMGAGDRGLKRKNAPANIITMPIPTMPIMSGPPSTSGIASAIITSPLPTPPLPSLAGQNRPARPSRLSTTFVHSAPSPGNSDAESRGSGDQNRPVKRIKRNRPPSSRRQFTPDDDEDAEGEEDDGDGEDASFEAGDYSAGAADDGALYCYCQRVSYGQMVGCDNPNCRYEWFHFECAGLKTQPEGAWYCKDCSETMAASGSNSRRRR